MNWSCKKILAFLIPNKSTWLSWSQIGWLNVPVYLGYFQFQHKSFPNFIKWPNSFFNAFYFIKIIKKKENRGTLPIHKTPWKEVIWNIFGSRKFYKNCCIELIMQKSSGIFNSKQINKIDMTFMVKDESRFNWDISNFNIKVTRSCWEFQFPIKWPNFFFSPSFL